MATSVRLIRRYVWLVDTIRRAGRLTLEEINFRWMHNSTLNHDHESEIPERTFHRHRDAILDLFDIEIACDRTSNEYYIANSEPLEQPSFTSWLFNGLALDNMLMSNQELKNKIEFEDTPGGTEHLPMIIEAIFTNRILAMTYRPFNHPRPSEWEIEPNGLKQYRRRWYLIGCRSGEDIPLTFSLDRIAGVSITDKIFEPGSDSVNELFSDIMGVNLDSDYEPEDIVVRVYGYQRNYFESTPLHHSQTLIIRTEDFSDYRFHLRAEYEFQHEILRLGPEAKVLSPLWLRDQLKCFAEDTLRRYNATN